MRATQHQELLTGVLDDKMKLPKELIKRFLGFEGVQTRTYFIIGRLKGVPLVPSIYY